MKVRISNRNRRYCGAILVIALIVLRQLMAQGSLSGDDNTPRSMSTNDSVLSATRDAEAKIRAEGFSSEAQRQALIEWIDHYLNQRDAINQFGIDVSDSSKQKAALQHLRSIAISAKINPSAGSSYTAGEGSANDSQLRAEENARIMREMEESSERDAERARQEIAQTHNYYEGERNRIQNEFTTQHDDLEAKLQALEGQERSSSRETVDRGPSRADLEAAQAKRQEYNDQRMEVINSLSEVGYTPEQAGTLADQMLLTVQPPPPDPVIGEALSNPEAFQPGSAIQDYPSDAEFSVDGQSIKMPKGSLPSGADPLQSDFHADPSNDLALGINRPGDPSYDKAVAEMRTDDRAITEKIEAEAHGPNPQAQLSELSLETEGSSEQSKTARSFDAFGIGVSYEAEGNAQTLTYSATKEFDVTDGVKAGVNLDIATTAISYPKGGTYDALSGTNISGLKSVSMDISTTATATATMGMFEAKVEATKSWLSAKYEPIANIYLAPQGSEKGLLGKVEFDDRMSFATPQDQATLVQQRVQGLQKVVAYRSGKALDLSPAQAAAYDQTTIEFAREIIRLQKGAQPLPK